jgi:hypothetical protein
MKLLLPNGRGGRFHQVLRWIDAHGLMIWASFLLAFIPLWPKIPLWSPIEQYIVRVRLEDFFILFGVALYGFLLWRRRVSLQTPLTKLVIGYAVVSFLSVASAIFVTGVCSDTRRRHNKNPYNATPNKIKKSSKRTRTMYCSIGLQRGIFGQSGINASKKLAHIISP